MLYHASGISHSFNSMFAADVCVQLLSGRQPYCWIKRVVHVISAINEGMEHFQTSDIADVNDSHKRYSLRCLSRDFRSRPDISEIVEFLATAE